MSRLHCRHGDDCPEDSYNECASTQCGKCQSRDLRSPLEADGGLLFCGGCHARFDSVEGSELDINYRPVDDGGFTPVYAS